MHREQGEEGAADQVDRDGDLAVSRGGRIEALLCDVPPGEGSGHRCKQRARRHPEAPVQGRDEQRQQERSQQHAVKGLQPEPEAGTERSEAPVGIAPTIAALARAQANVITFLATISALEKGMQWQ